MGNFKDENKIGDLRERLYAREQNESETPKDRPSLNDIKTKDQSQSVSTDWQEPPKPIAEKKGMFSGLGQKSERDSSVASDSINYNQPKKSYRKAILLSGLGFFVLAMLVSSLFFVFGGNSISGDNIAIDISGPFTIGGGDAIPLQVGITNQNSVAIESATLIISYPADTQSAEESGKSLTTQRLSLETLDPGETLNIPLRALVFGEENEEKIINAEVEYRVQGSNSTFAKQAEPLRFKISSSPVVIDVQSVQKIASGQETEIKIKVSSNSTNVLRDVLVRADYPAGFDFIESDPEPVSGENVWQIDELAPSTEEEITLKGILVGNESDEYSIHYSVGVSNDSNRLNLASVYTTASTNFEIESPFIGVELLLNGDSSGSVSLMPGRDLDLKIRVTNTLEDTIYDGRVALNLSGNALSAYEVDPGRGFYDSINNVVRFESSANQELAEIAPGERVELTVGLSPDPNIRTTPQLAFDVDVRATRVTPERVDEELIGTAAGVAKVSSQAFLLAEASRGTSVFAESGPVPPVANQSTTYTITLLAENGTNDIADTEITASLPVYVSWLDKTSGAGDITFNETNRTITWRVGDIDANQSKIASFQVSILPSVAQIGTTPTLLGEQRLQATDRFTGESVQARSSALTTKLPAEAGFDDNDGKVQAP